MPGRTADAGLRHPLPPVQRIIDLDAVAHNLRVVAATAGVPVMAVVKADAFGHGAVEVARTVLANGADRLGVATVSEALALRRAGIDAPVLAWLVDPRCDLDGAIASGVTLSCANKTTLTAVSRAADRVGRRAIVHLELDTGMSRSGSTPAAWDALCRAAAGDPRVEVDGVWSHLACAADPCPDAVATQVRRFEYGLGVARASGVVPRVRHLANSAAALAHPPTRYDMVRVAAALYGIETVTGRTHGLRPAMRVVGRVTQVRRVPAGTGVGYQFAFRTRRATTLALIPAGYGDGVPRHLADPGAHGPMTVSIGGTRHPIVGSVSMDQLTVDVGDAVVRIGDEVELLGGGAPSASEWALHEGTVPHEILTGFGSRVATSWIGGDA